MRPVLIAHNEPDDFRDLLATRFPDLRFVYARRPKRSLRGCETTTPRSSSRSSTPGLRIRCTRRSPATRRFAGSGGRVGVRPPRALGRRADHGDEWRRRARPVPRGDGHRGDARPRLRVPGLCRAAARAPVAAGPVHPAPGRALLVVGFGHIGECVARNAKALGMRVLATRATPAPHPAADAVHGPARSRPSSPKPTSCRSTCASTWRPAGSSPARRSRP